ncbi:aldehyde ferredoxin oxidoreductase family protein [Natrinema caseinilyticum]|uniref:aldehyde ferredoxin oxidoreductase family protein n=1 Tax=Natrinema caseinilyticum TaxID=2961570 RepID=UPI0020C57455|nr:aldehyde ferredoxin oxidoreductase C-terminal domain-containing protein [Natrinema caseinilyticum]
MLHAEGPLLTVDVGAREVTETPIDEELATFVGGRGVATKLAHERIPFDAPPLGPENRLYLATGPLQMSQMSFTGRMSLTGLSPLTDGLLSTNAGGYLSRNFADTGYSAVEFVGESDDLLAIHIRDDGVEFESVPELEQALVPEVTEYMDENHGLESENLVTIGPAGENRVRFASVMTYDSRAFGRGGLGAVFGAKNIKTVSFRGDSRPAIDVPDVQQEVHQAAATADDMMRERGTTSYTEFINDQFSLPTRYFKEHSFDGADGIGGEAVAEKKYRKGACSVCAFACKLPTRDEETGLETEGPEFETVFAFGSNVMVDDMVAVMKSNELCDTLGLDTISAGDAVAAYLDSEDEFGNVDLIHELTEKIAYRDGVGDLLAEGVERFHDELGVENWTVKGLEFAAHDGRVLHGQGLSYAVANRGADHMYARMQGPEYRGEIDPETLEGKPEVLITRENVGGFRDSAIVCAFSDGYIDENQYEELFQADYSDLLDVGSRVVELERHFNNKRGMDRSDDQLPYDLPGLEDAIAEYYRLRGWNDDGTVPDDAVGSYSPADD